MLLVCGERIEALPLGWWDAGVRGVVAARVGDVLRRNRKASVSIEGRVSVAKCLVCSRGD